MKSKYTVVQFGKKKFNFLSSFDQFTLTTIKGFMNAMDSYDAKAKELQDCTTKALALKENDIERIQFAQAEIDSLVMEIRSCKISILSSLCLSENFEYFADSTKGVNYELINKATDHCIERLGDFTEYWDNCPPVLSFKHKIYKFLPNKSYCIHEMSANTLIREHLASEQLKAAFGYKNQLDNKKWDSICSFVAVIVRPVLQIEDIGFGKSFLNQNKLKGMDHVSKLSFYECELNKVWDKRAKQFETLPLNVAIGCIKEFWKKKRN